MAVLEPDPSIGSYDDVRFYRKTWFVVVLMLFIAPLLLPILLTGTYFQKARSKQREESDAEVWRATGSGRMLIGAIAGFYALNTAQVIIPMISEALESSGSTEAAQPLADPEPEERDEAAASDDDGATNTTEPTTNTEPPRTTAATTEAPTTEAPVTTVAPTTSGIAAVETSWNDDSRGVTLLRLEDIRSITTNMAETVLGTNQADLAIEAIIGDDRFGDTPLPDDAQLISLSVSHELVRDQSQIAVVPRYVTTQSATEAVTQLRAFYAERGFIEDDITTDERDGEVTTSIDFEPLETGAFDRDSVTVDVIDGDDGVVVRVFRFIIDPDRPDDTSPLSLAERMYPVPLGYETVGSEISMRRSLSEGASIGTTYEVRAVARAGTSIDSVHDEFATTGGDVWVEDRRTEASIYLESREADAEATVYVFAGSSDTSITVTIRD